MCPPLKKTFVGFGFGPIQSGLFLLEAFESGNFGRLVSAEVAVDIVDAVRRSGGRYTVNVAEADGIRSHVVEGLEILNPLDPAGQVQLVSAITAADEIATALPSVEFFLRGCPSPVDLLAKGLRNKFEAGDNGPTLVYAAENHNHAAEILHDEVRSALSPAHRGTLDACVQFVNTVIGKMSGVVAEPGQLEREGLLPLVDAGDIGVLVEQFNRILIEKVWLPGFDRGLDVFEEKQNLLPFEEAKLYGHNAAHALMGYLAHRRGMRLMSEMRDHDLLTLIERAFLEESGKPLCRRHAGVDPLFTEAGWQAYVSDLLQRMTNPFLQDRVDRVIRDARRKLGWNDRLIGTMRLALQYQVQPSGYAMGAAAATQLLLTEQQGVTLEQLLADIWAGANTRPETRNAVTSRIAAALDQLA